MTDGDASDKGFDNLPFHEYCANCNQKFDATVLDPKVTVVEVEEERVIHSFCDEVCLIEWRPDE